MLSSLMPATLMFAITVFFVTIFFVPATIFQRTNKLVNFYWVGFWLFLGLITSIAGAQNTLMLLGYDSDALAESLLFAATVCFVFFVVFAWFRLSSKALMMGLQKLFHKVL